MSRVIPSLALMAIVAGALGPAAASAQPPTPHPPTLIQLRPAAAPRPALKYRLVPERRARVAGNAAIFYHRAIQLVLENQSRTAIQARGKARPNVESVDERITHWGSIPLAEVPRDEARAQLDLFRLPLHEVELGASHATCDWELDQRKEGISLMLPEIQMMRTLARIVTVRVRLAILDGKTDEAMHWIEVGLVMGRHVSQGPVVIQGLVGVAIDSLITNCLVDLIQAPGTPSLFWALADRPRPFIDLRQSLEGERYLLEKELPGLDELERGPWSLDEARKFASELQRKLFDFARGEPIPGGDGTAIPNLPATARRLGIAAMCAKIYPEARRALIAQGRPEAEVEAMPVVQVAALYTFREYRDLRDESYKWMNLPYWQSFDRVDRSMNSTVEEKLANPLLAMFRIPYPALNSIRLAPLRLERQLDAIECVESIRMYAAAHDGKLPASLDDLKDAPVPLDPATGRSFDYKLEGDTATLSAPIPPGGPDHWSYKINYVLKLTR